MAQTNKQKSKKNDNYDDDDDNKGVREDHCQGFVGPRSCIAAGWLKKPKDRLILLALTLRVK